MTKRIDIIATVIKFNGTLDDLKDLELSYAPPFSTAKDIVNYAGYVGSSIFNNQYKQINYDKVRELVENKDTIIVAFISFIVNRLKNDFNIKYKYIKK